MPQIKRLSTVDADFWPRLADLTAWEGVADEAVITTVREILAQVRARGDDALLEYTRRFDARNAVRAADLEIPTNRLQQALDTLPTHQREALEIAAAHIRAYAERQKQESWCFTEA
ncbi:MAG TPA: histidinol dehydrogenase, partial [Candidatus Competibacter sp.]|nr:histidinol dehydrogenase [Candidatus Competibacter sp.]